MVDEVHLDSYMESCIFNSSGRAEDGTLETKRRLQDTAHRTAFMMVEYRLARGVEWVSIHTSQAYLHSVCIYANNLKR